MEDAVVGRFLKRLTSMVFGSGFQTWALFPSRKAKYKHKVDMTDASVVMAPVLWLMRVFPEAPIAVSVDEELDHAHPMVRLVRRPNPYYSGLMLWMATVLSLVLDGNAYWAIVRTRGRRPVGLYYIPHWLVEPVSSATTEFVSYYRYKVDGREIRLESEDVVHFRYGLDPSNVRKGLSPLKSAVRLVFTDEEAEAFAASVLQNGGVPGIVLSPKGDAAIPAPDVDDVKDYVSKAFTGGGRGEPFVSSLPVEISEYGWDPEKLNLSALRAIPEERITALLGVPAAVVGFGTGLEQTKVGATMREMRELAYENGIIPLQRLVAEELHTQLLPEFEADPDRAEVVFDLSKVRVLQEDQNALVERVDRMVQGGWLRVDQAQAMVGLEVDATQSFYLRRIAMLEVPSGSQRELPSEEPEPETRARKAAGDDAELGRRLVEALRKDREALQASFEAGLAARFNAFGDRVANAAVEIANRRGTFVNVRSTDAERKDAGDEVLVEMILAEVLTPEAKQELLQYAAFYVQVAGQTIDTLNAVAELNVNMSAPLEARVVEHGGRRLGLVDLEAQTKRELFDAIRSARETGEGPREMARWIRERVPAGPWRDSETRAHVIARTETKYAQNISSLEVYTESENVQSVRVYDSQLGSFDAWCDAVNGRVVTFSQARYLADEEHPNGTRSFAPVVSAEPVDVDGLPVGVEPNTEAA